MKTKLLPTLLLLITTTTWADWAHIGKTDLADLYIEPASIRKDGNLVTATQLTDYKQQQDNGGLSLLTTVEYNCPQAQYRLVSVRRLAEPMGVGATLLETDNGPWYTITPDTASETLFLILCNP